MKKSTQSNFIWISFTDLLSSLFFIVLILFVVTHINSKQVTKENNLLKEELTKKENNIKIYKKLLDEQSNEVRAGKSVIEVYNSIQDFFKDSEYFEYNFNCKRFEMKQNVQFDGDSDVIKEEDKHKLIQSGNTIYNFIYSHKIYNNLKFLIIIEGRAAKTPGLEDFGRKLSYRRSVSLYKLWEENNIYFNTNNSELLLAGSGFEGKCRYSDYNDELNRRFIIQIIPVMDVKEIIAKGKKNEKK